MDKNNIEQILLGKLILEPELLEKYNFHVDIFQTPLNKEIYTIIDKYKQNGTTIDIITISKKLNHLDNCTSYLSLLLDKGHIYADVQSLILELDEISKTNKLLHIAQDIDNSVSNHKTTSAIMYEIQKNLESINDNTTQELSSLSDLLKNTLEDINKRMSTDGLLGIATGFDKIDKFTGGWQESDLVIIGGASSMGKTSFALALLLNACVYSNCPSVIFSYEMSGTQLLKRLISMESGVNNSYIINGTLGKDEYLHVNQAIAKIEKLPLNIDECNITSLNYLIKKTKEYVRVKNVKLVLVDYLQLVSYSNKNSTREQEVSKVARTLKNLAKELNITIIALSQLNRGVGMRAMGKPTLSDLRESGEIEQASDVVILIHRPEYYGIEHDDKGEPTKGMANIIFAKGRNIGVGEIPLRFNSSLTKFENL